MIFADLDATVTLTAEFRDEFGELVDPQDPTLDILYPNDVVAATDREPYRVSEGVYEYAFDVAGDGPVGVWTASWTGTIEGTPLTIDDPFVVLDASGLVLAGINELSEWPQGSSIPLYGVFRSPDGALFDPDVVSLEVLVPSNASLMTITPVKVKTGVYLYTLVTTSESSVGAWTARWTITVDDVDYSTDDPFILTALPAHLFGATLAGVQALLPWLEISNDSRLTDTQIHGFLDGIAAEVSLRIGDYGSALTDEGLVSRITGMARHVAQLGAAAMAEDAVYPTRAVPNDTSYGNVLWLRYQQALGALVEVVNNATPGVDPGAVVTGGGAVSAPGPQFRVGMAT